jgi:hypothetical protein
MMSSPKIKRNPPGLPAGPCFHFSVDDVFALLFARPDGSEPLRFLLSLGADLGVASHLYLFQRGEAGGRPQSLDDLAEAQRAFLREQTCLLFGPHALDYATRPYEQSVDGQRATFSALFAQIGRFAARQQSSPLLRLHFFSECLELAPWFLESGVTGLLLTDKAALTYRLGSEAKGQLMASGWTEHEGLALVTSHLRFERCLADGMPPSAVLEMAREIIGRHGFVTLFTHEVDLHSEDLRAMIRVVLAGLRALGVASG